MGIWGIKEVDAGLRGRHCGGPLQMGVSHAVSCGWASVGLRRPSERSLCRPSLPPRLLPFSFQAG
eukprot:15126544-Alexandrium_andersonii.AAC.1